MIGLILKYSRTSALWREYPPNNCHAGVSCARPGVAKNKTKTRSSFISIEWKLRAGKVQARQARPIAAIAPGKRAKVLRLEIRQERVRLRRLQFVRKGRCGEP